MGSEQMLLKQLMSSILQFDLLIHGPAQKLRIFSLSLGAKVCPQLNFFAKIVHCLVPFTRLFIHLKTQSTKDVYSSDLCPSLVEQVHFVTLLTLIR